MGEFFDSVSKNHDEVHTSHIDQGEAYYLAISDPVIATTFPDLLRRQQPDGGWPITWDAPGPAAICEWRGRWTLEAISTLVAYGTITHCSGKHECGTDAGSGAIV